MRRLSVILVATGLSLGAVSVGVLVWCGVQAFEAQYVSGYVDGHRAGTDFALMEIESPEAASESEAEDDYARGFRDGEWEGRFQAIEEFGDVLVSLGVKTEAEVEKAHQLIERVRSYDRK